MSVRSEVFLYIMDFMFRLSLLLCFFFYCIFTIFPKLDFYCIHNDILQLLLELEVKFPLGNSLAGLIKNLSIRLSEPKPPQPITSVKLESEGFLGILRLDVLLPTWDTFCSSPSDWLYVHPIALAIDADAVLSPSAGASFRFWIVSESFLNCDVFRLFQVDLIKMCETDLLYFTSHYQRGIEK